MEYDLNKTNKCKGILYNPEASDENIKVIGGESTKILNLENIKYQWAHDIFDAIFKNNWLPHKTPMGNDKAMWNKLTQYEKDAYEDIISFLVFLDSIQTNNLPNISDYITAPDIVYVIARQTMDEAIHSKSYGWILSSIFGHRKAKEIIYKWRHNKVIGKRNQFIADWYEQFIGDKNDENFVVAAVANYLLEGLYFYNGFQFFHNLAARGLMIGTDTQIRYIQRDEIQHCNIFKNIILELKKENTDLMKKMQPVIDEMFIIAYEQEVNFSKQTMGNNILGITEDSIEQYAKYLVNVRRKDIKMELLFEKVDNPYKHLDLIAGLEDETSNRTNNFEATSIAYKNKSAIEGWDEI